MTKNTEKLIILCNKINGTFDCLQDLVVRMPRKIKSKKNSLMKEKR